MPRYIGRDAAYYQKLHDTALPYQENNWLLDELDFLRQFKANSAIELGCGNGKFLDAAAPLFKRLVGCDWAVSPCIQEILDSWENVAFHKVDLTYEQPPVANADLVVSADFMEHLEREAILKILPRIDKVSPKAFHKIACYDDGNCHMTVLSPAEWLSIFQSVNPSYVLHKVEERLGNKAKVVATIVKGLPMDISIRPLKLNFGCNDTRLDGYIGIDVRPCKGADYVMPAWETGEFQPGTVDEIYSRHMLEHLTVADAKKTLVNWYSLLRVGGVMHIIVPDLAFHARQLLGSDVSWVKDKKFNLEHAMAGFYGWQRNGVGGVNEDAHRWGYTWETLSALLVEIGFLGVKRVVTGTDSEHWHLHVTAMKRR